MQLFGKSAKIAISSVMVILSREAGTMTSAGEIAKALHESSTYVAKILQALVRQGILGSRRGASGGFYLNAKPEAVTLWDLVSPFEGDLDAGHCMIDGGNVCDEGNVCGMHPYWARINDEIVRTLRETTVLELWRHSSRNPDAEESALVPRDPGCGEAPSNEAS